MARIQTITVQSIHRETQNRRESPVKSTLKFIIKIMRKIASKIAVSNCGLSQFYGTKPTN